MILLELKDIKKYFHSKPVLNGINMSVRRGESITIFGPNGAGKTTLVKILSGIMSPGEGKILFHGSNSSGLELKKNIFFLGHKNSLYNALTITENLNFVNKLFCRSNGLENIDTILRDHGLWERRNDPVKELSQGMKRRVAIAKGFIIDPKILILDEPFMGLDLKWRRMVLSKIREFKKAGKSFVMVTHLVEEGYELADRIAFMNKGNFLFVKDKNEVPIRDICDLFHSLGETV
jgi:ABC-type multidrug transport system ATPase subunit